MQTVYAALRFENIEDINPDRLHDLAMRIADECHEKSDRTFIQLRGECYSHVDMINRKLGFFPRGSNPAISVQAFDVKNQAVQNINNRGAEGLFLLALAILMEAKYRVNVLYFDTRLSQDHLDDALSIARSVDRSILRPDWLVAPEPVIPGPVVIAQLDRAGLPAFMDYSR